MASTKQAPSWILAARKYPTPKRKPARFSCEAAHAGAHSIRKPKSRTK